MSAGVVIWVTGLPSAGKTTFAKRLVEGLRARGDAACLLDGDAVRETLVPKVGYAPEERDAFYATLAGLAALLASQGLTAVIAATAHRKAFRERARALSPAFLEVFVDTPLEECERRDAKGLYDESRAGKVRALPGAGAAYEPPEAPDVVAHGGRDADALGRALAQSVRSHSVDPKGAH